MDKDKITDDILNEWAMRSPDGLSAGHNTPTNAAILQEMMKEMAKPSASSNSQKRSADTTKYYPKANKNAANIILKKKLLTPEMLHRDKGFRAEFAQYVFDAIACDEEHSVDFVKTQYNQHPKVEDAVTFLNQHGRDGEYKNIFLALEALRNNEKGVGGGEWPLVLLIAGCKTGLGDTGDLITQNQGIIDVKEAEDEKCQYMLSEGSFKDEFAKVPYVDAVLELNNALGKREYYDALTSILDESLGQTNPLYAKKREAVKEITQQYFDYRTLQKIGTGVLSGLNLVRTYLDAVHPRDAVKAAVGDVASFDFNGDEYVVGLEDVPDIEKNKIEHPPKKAAAPVNLNVKSLDSKEDVLIISKIKKLKYFSAEPPLTPSGIAQSFIKASAEHYTGGIVFYFKTHKEGILFEYARRLDKLNPPFKLTGGSNGIQLTRIASDYGSYTKLNEPANDISNEKQ